MREKCEDCVWYLLGMSRTDKGEMLELRPAHVCRNGESPLGGRPVAGFEGCVFFVLENLN